jgi:hypothetical protein
MLKACKLPFVSRLTMALRVARLVGAIFQFRPSVPLEVTGEPVTVKSEERRSGESDAAHRTTSAHRLAGPG